MTELYLSQPLYASSEIAHWLMKAYEIISLVESVMYIPKSYKVLLLLYS